MLSDVEGFEIVDGSFITSSKTFETKLAPGNYAFVEEQAPAGYSKTAPIKFTTINNASVSIEKTMTDKLTQLDVRKVDKDARNTLLGGATIQILNEDKLTDTLIS